jgi:hypothetical protein
MGVLIFHPSKTRVISKKSIIVFLITNKNLGDIMAADLTSQIALLIIANVILIITAIFLFFKIRKAFKKPEKEQRSELVGSTDIPPEGSGPEGSSLIAEEVTPPENSLQTSSDISAPGSIAEAPEMSSGEIELKLFENDGESEIETSEEVGLKLEDELFEKNEEIETYLDKKIQKNNNKKKSVKVKNNIRDERETASRKKGNKKKKYIKEESQEMFEAIIKDETKPAPKRKVGKKKKTSAQKEPIAKIKPAYL